MSLLKEVTINFRTTTLGIFDVVTPVLEDGEIFNSGFLKDYINQMIAAGKRNFSIDLSPLDYVYSDSINVLMVLNKRVLEISGRLTLLTPQPEVIGILQKAGIPNIMRVFDSEADLLRTSEEIMAMTPGYKVGDLQNVADALDEPLPPQSEFESLRSEIGSVFGGSPEPAAPKRAARPVPPPPPVRSPEPASQNQFDIFPMGNQNKTPAAPTPPPLPPKAPAFPPPVQPPAPQGRPAAQRPAEFPGSDFKEDSYTPETRRFAQAPVPPVPPPERPSSFDDFEDQPKKGKKQKDDFDSDRFEDEFEGKKKGFPVLALVAVLVFAIVGAGSYFLFFKKAPSSSSAPVASVTEPKPAPTVPEVPTSAPAVEEKIPETKIETPKAPEPVKEEKKAPIKKAEAPKKSEPAPKVVKSEPKPVPAKEPEPVPAKAPAGKNQIVITSTPSGADVIIDGSKMGITPYTWTTPFYGDMKIVVSKPGFSSESKSMEYTGGSIDEAFTLKPQAAAPAPAPVPAPAPAPAAPAPAPAAPAPVATPAPAPAPIAPPPPPPAPAPAPAPAPVAGGSIYIASLPPNADVYVGGRLIGKTNDTELQVPVGTHKVKFVKGAVEKIEEMTFQPGKNPTKFVKLQ